MCSKHILIFHKISVIFFINIYKLREFPKPCYPSYPVTHKNRVTLVTQLRIGKIENYIGTFERVTT